MNKILKLKKIAIFLAMVFMLVISLGSSVQAVIDNLVDITRLVTLTIVNMEDVDGTAGEKPIIGAEFTIYKVAKETNTEAEARIYISEHKVTPYNERTDNEGKAIFRNIYVGRYFVEQSKIPEGVESKIQSFFIDLPFTSQDGDDWNYNVTIYPKNLLSYGKVTLIEKDESNNYIEGSVWKLQQKVNGEWKEYNEETYTNEENKECTRVRTYTTKADGSFTVDNLEPATYRLIELSNVNKYIMQWKSVQEFTVNSQKLNHTINITGREKPSIKKYVLYSSSTNKVTSAFKTDDVSWKTEVEVPSIISSMGVFRITDKIDANMKYKNNTYKVTAFDKYNNKVDVPSSSYEISTSDNEIVVNFKPSLISGYNLVYLTYTTTFRDSANLGNYFSEADLSYTKSIDENGTSQGEYTITSDQARVRLGGLAIKKINTSGEGLEGATFKIAKSLLEAKNGAFIKNSAGVELHATTDENGYGLISELKCGEFGQSDENAKTKYWLVEVQAPTGYELFEEPLEVEVAPTSHLSDNAIEITNKANFVLPNTGGNITQFISIILSLSIILISIIIIKKDNKEKAFEIEKKD